MNEGLTEEELQLLLAKDNTPLIEDKDAPFLPRSKRSRKKRTSFFLSWIKK